MAKRKIKIVETADLRFKDTVPLRKFRSKVIGIAGLGAVGRHVAILLGVMGHKHLYGADPDMVEVKNIGTQGWAPADVGCSKAQVLARQITNDRASMNAQSIRFEHDPVLLNTPDIFFCCVDTMSARKSIWNGLTTAGNCAACEGKGYIREPVKKLCEKCGRSGLQGLWLDSRMASRVIRIIAVDLSSQPDRDHYEKTLFGDSEAFEGSCTDRMTVYGAYVAAGLMVSQMVNWLKYGVVNKDFVFETLAMSVNKLEGKKGD